MQVKITLFPHMMPHFLGLALVSKRNPIFLSIPGYSGYPVNFFQKPLTASLIIKAHGFLLHFKQVNYQRHDKHLEFRNVLSYVL